MENDKQNPAGQQPAESGASPNQAIPQDALGKTNDEISEEAAVNNTGSIDGAAAASEAAAKKPKGFKAVMRKVNVYLLGFLLVVAVVAATGIVSYLNSKKVPKTAEIASQSLSTEELKQLANSNASVGNAAQTLTVQGNAIFSGQVLVQKDLDVAGRIRLGGDLQVQTLTAAGKTNLADTQINSLQVANATTLQGLTTLKDVNIAGTAAFGGAVTAAQITVTKLVMSGNAILQVPNHLSFTGGPASRTIDTAVLGAGGTSSISGSDTSGTININTGNTPIAGCFVKVTFNQPYTSQPHVIISPIGSAAAQTQYYVTRTTTGFNLCTNNAAPANQVFAFDYFVAG